MTKPLVLITDITDLDVTPAVELLSTSGCEVAVLNLRTERMIDPSHSHAVGAIVGYASIDEHVLAQLPGLRVTATMSTGTDMIDELAARNSGVEVIGLNLS